MKKKPKGSERFCANGHRYFKSSDCPVCPVCEKEKKPADGFLSLFSAPARRALLSAGIDSIDKVSGFTEKELLRLHGFGPSSLPKLKKVLAEHGLSFLKKK